MDEKIFTLYVNLQDKEFKLPDLLRDKKFIIAICPYSIVNGNCSAEAIKNVREYLDRGCLLGQRGYVGRCKYPHSDGTDPWHENLCTDWNNPRLSLEEQLEFMHEGKELLTEVFKKPEVYCPINHLYDDNTVMAGQVLKYPYMMDQNHMGLPPYVREGLVIIPEQKLERDVYESSIGVYTSLDMANEDWLEDYLKTIELALPDEITPQKVSNELLLKNELAKRIHKLERDLKRI